MYAATCGDTPRVEIASQPGRADLRRIVSVRDREGSVPIGSYRIASARWLPVAASGCQWRCAQSNRTRCLAGDQVDATLYYFGLTLVVPLASRPKRSRKVPCKLNA